MTEPSGKNPRREGRVWVVDEFDDATERRFAELRRMAEEGGHEGFDLDADERDVTPEKVAPRRDD